jgi:hypothetical protein
MKWTRHSSWHTSWAGGLSKDDEGPGNATRSWFHGKNCERLQGRRRPGGARGYEQIVGRHDRVRRRATVHAGILQLESGFSRVCLAIRTQERSLIIEPVNFIFSIDTLLGRMGWGEISIVGDVNKIGK